MADEEQQPAGGSEPEGAEQVDEEQLRAQLEEEIRKVTVQDVVLQSVVSILNLSARRIAKEDERDLEQAKVGIDAGRALVDLVKPEAQPQLRQAISELQLLYAKQAEGGSDDSGGGDGGDEGEEKPPEQGTSERPKGDSGLWTPPGAG